MKYSKYINAFTTFNYYAVAKCLISFFSVFNSLNSVLDVFQV